MSSYYVWPKTSVWCVKMKGLIRKADTKILSFKILFNLGGLKAMFFCKIWYSILVWIIAVGDTNPSHTLKKILVNHFTYRYNVIYDCLVLTTGTDYY